MIAAQIQTPESGATQALVRDFQNAIYQHGSKTILVMVRDALTEVGKHDPLSEQLAEQLSDMLLWQDDFSKYHEAEDDEIELIQPDDDLPF